MPSRSTLTQSFVKGRRMRITRLDACGRPVYGDESFVVSNGVVSVAFTARTNETDATSVTNMAGETIISEPADVSLDGYGVEITFAQVDPDLLALITGQEVLFDAFGRVVGFDIDTKVKLTGSGFALEVWLGAPTGDACAPGNAAAQGQYGYILLPFVQGGILGDFTVENGPVSFVITGAGTRNGGSWGKGPYDVMLQPVTFQPGPMLKPVSSTITLRSLLVDVAPPAATSGARPLFDGTATPLTSVSAIVEGSVATISVLPDAAADEPIYYEFGDGTWDYVIGNGGDTDHTYELEGTYTIVATNGGGAPVSTTVTIGA